MDEFDSTGNSVAGGLRMAVHGEESTGGGLLEEAWSLHARGQRDQSREVFQRLVGTGQHLDDAYYGLGFVALERGELDEADAALRQAVRANPRHANARYFIGFVAERRGDRAVAREIYQQVLDLQHDHVSARSRLEALSTEDIPTPPPSRAPRAATAPPVSPGAAPAPVQVPPLARQPSPRAAWGRVSGLRERQERRHNYAATYLVMTFRLEQMSSDGMPQPPLPVEMRGQSLRGSIANGDWIELPKRWKVGKTPTSVVNLLTGEKVTLKSWWQ